MENTIMAEMLEEMKKQNTALYTTLAELVNNQLSGMQAILSKADINREQTRTDADEKEKSINRESTRIDANKKDYKRNEIIAMMYLNGITPIEVAKKLKLHRSTVSNVMSKREKSKRIANFIAKQIGGKREEIFGY